MEVCAQRCLCKKRSGAAPFLLLSIPTSFAMDSLQDTTESVSEAAGSSGNHI